MGQIAGKCSIKCLENDPVLICLNSCDRPWRIIPGIRTQTYDRKALWKMDLSVFIRLNTDTVLKGRVSSEAFL